MKYTAQFTVLCTIISKKTNVFSTETPPCPYPFVKTMLKSTVELQPIVDEIARLLPQLSNFISQFHSLVQGTDVNVVTDTTGNLSVDVSSSMPSEVSEKIVSKISVIDRLITSHNESLHSLFQKGFEKQKETNVDPKLSSELSKS